MRTARRASGLVLSGRQSPVGYKNLVANSDFSNGLSTWDVGTLASATLVGNSASCLANAQNDYIGKLIAGTVIGHIYYARSKIQASSNLVKLSFAGATAAHSGSGLLENVSKLSTAASSSHSYTITDTRASGWNTYIASETFLIDLTALFGPGNEPTLAWCDANLPFTATQAIALAMPANLSDRSRFGNHGAFTGATWVQLPTGAWVMDFIGAGRKTTIAASESINNLPEFSISFWVKYVNAGTGRCFDKIVKRAYRDSSNFFLYFDHGFSTTGGSWRTPINSIPNNVWKNVQISYDNKLTTNDPVICVNGVLVVATEVTTPVGTASLDAANALIFGNRLEADRDLNGYLSAPKIYNYLRTEAQALAAYNAEKHLYGL